MGLPLIRRGQLTNVAALMPGAAVVSSDNTFDFIKDFQASADGAAATLDCTVSFDSTTSLKVAFVKNEGNSAGAPFTCTGLAGDVSGAWTALTSRSHSNNDMSGRWFYKLSGAGTDTKVMATFSSASAVFKKILVSEWEANTPAIFNAEVVASGTGTAISSGNLTTVGAGLVLGGYAAYNNNAVSGLLINGNSGVNSPEVNTTFTQTWGSQVSTIGSVSASATVASSSSWICNAISFKGTGARGATSNNYAHGYQNTSAQANGTTLSTAILAAAQTGQGNVSGQYSFNGGSTTGLTVETLTGSRTNPLICAGITFATGATSKGVGCLHTTNNNYWIKNINRHRRINLGFLMELGPTAVGVGIFDLVSVHSAAGNVLNITQLRPSVSYNLGVEYIDGGTNHSAGFTATVNGVYKVRFYVNTQTRVCRFKVWDSSNVLVCDDTPGVANFQEDIDIIRVGNAEAGLEALKITKIKELFWNFDSDDLQIP